MIKRKVTYIIYAILFDSRKEINSIISTTIFEKLLEDFINSFMHKKNDFAKIKI